jgi:hypothetical protein
VRSVAAAALAALAWRRKISKVAGKHGGGGGGQKAASRQTMA